MTRGLAFAAACGAVALAAGSPAAGQTFADDNYRGPPRAVGSADPFVGQIGVGLWEPDPGTGAFGTLFDGDQGPLIQGEIDYLPLRIPYVGRLGVGLQVGWARYTGDAIVSGSDQRSDEEASLTLFPLAALAVLRVDVLPRHLGVPLVLSGKIGADGIVWRSEVGERTEARNVTFGLRWAAQAALELDFFDPRAARRLDDEWGINHTFLFFEVFGSTANTTLTLTTDLAWVAGLGLAI